MTVTDWRTLYITEGDDTWRLDAACIDQADVFFNHVEAVNGAAKQICRACPVIEDCLAYALKIRPMFGIWAGRSPRELEAYRRRLRGPRRKKAS